MVKFTQNEKNIIMSALNFALKNEQNALEASALIVPVAIKVQNLEVEPEAENVQ